MPIYRSQVLNLAVGATNKPDLKPNDRFGPRGGHVRIRAKQNNTTAGFTIAETVFIGNEMVENRAQITSDAAGQVDNFTPALEAVGGPGDVIDITYTNIGTATAATASINFVVEIENA
jgi:hypothetical protein